MFWDCEFSGCTSKSVSKVVNGVIMIKRIQPLHSSECLKAQAERKSSKSENEGKILTPENGLAKEHAFLGWSSDDSDDSSSESDDDPELNSSEEWSTDDHETDDQIENNGEELNQIKTNGYSVLSHDDSDSFIEVLLPEKPSHQKN